MILIKSDRNEEIWVNDNNFTKCIKWNSFERIKPGEPDFQEGKVTLRDNWKYKGYILNEGFTITEADYIRLTKQNI